MIYVFIAPGFEEIEAVTAVDILRRAELEVQTVAVGGVPGGTLVTGAHGITLRCDITEEESTPEGLTMVVLPGGIPGALNLERSPMVRDFLELAVSMNIPLGAICAAPSILGRMGLLEGRKVTCYPGFDTQLPPAAYTGSKVEVDGNLITADGPGAATGFALALVANLLGQERADILKASL